MLRVVPQLKLDRDITEKNEGQCYADYSLRAYYQCWNSAEEQIVLSKPEHEYMSVNNI